MTIPRKKKPGFRVATARQGRAFEKAFAEIRRQEEQKEKWRREQPHRNFIAGALGAGFTQEQADFLWDNRPRKPWDGRVGSNA